MGDKAVEILEGELGVKLTEETPPKPVRVRKADVQSSKKKKEGAPTSPRQVPKKARKERARPTSNQDSNNDVNPLEWFTLNRCMLLAVLTIVVSTGVNSLNETLGAFWEVEDVELTVEELALRHSNMAQDSAPEETESSLWDSLLRWRWGSNYDCETDDCDDDNAVHDDNDEDDSAVDDDDDDDDDNDAVVDDDDDDDDDDNDDVDDDDEGHATDDDDDDDGPKEKLKRKVPQKRGLHRESEREEHIEKPRKQRTRERKEDTTEGKRVKERLTRQKHSGEEEEEKEERPRRKRQKEEREQRQG